MRTALDRSPRAARFSGEVKAIASVGGSPRLAKAGRAMSVAGFPKLNGISVVEVAER